MAQEHWELFEKLKEVTDSLNNANNMEELNMVSGKLEVLTTDAKIFSNKVDLLSIDDKDRVSKQMLNTHLNEKLPLLNDSLAIKMSQAQAKKRQEEKQSIADQVTKFSKDYTILINEKPLEAKQLMDNIEAVIKNLKLENNYITASAKSKSAQEGTILMQDIDKLIEISQEVRDTESENALTQLKTTLNTALLSKPPTSTRPNPYGQGSANYGATRPNPYAPKKQSASSTPKITYSEKKVEAVVEPILRTDKPSDAVLQTPPISPIEDIIQADRKRFDFARHTPIALIDVDDTLIGKDGRLNHTLIQSLKSQGITQAILFSTSNISQASSQASYNGTRLDAINLLEKAGIRVVSTVLSSSPYFDPDKPLGSFYDNIYKPLEQEVINQKDNVHPDLYAKTDTLNKNELAHDEKFGNVNTQYSEQEEYKGGKETMLRHIIESLPDGANVLVFDDKREVANVVRAVAGENEIKQRGILLDVVEVSMSPREELNKAERQINKYDQEKLNGKALNSVFAQTIEELRKKLPEMKVEFERRTVINSQEGYAHSIKSFKSKIPVQNSLKNLVESKPEDFELIFNIELANSSPTEKQDLVELVANNIDARLEKAISDLAFASDHPGAKPQADRNINRLKLEIDALKSAAENNPLQEKISSLGEKLDGAIQASNNKNKNFQAKPEASTSTHELIKNSDQFLEKLSGLKVNYKINLLQNKDKIFPRNLYLSLDSSTAQERISYSIKHNKDVSSVEATIEKKEFEGNGGNYERLLLAIKFPSYANNEVILHKDDKNALLKIELAKGHTPTYSVEDNRIANLIKNNIATPEEIAENAKNTHPIMHAEVNQLITDFIKYKKENGSTIEKKLYANMTNDQFIERLLTKRPITFYDTNDTYILRDGSRGAGGFENIGTKDETDKLVLAQYLSYDEMKISAQLSVSVPTHFINKGDRSNSGKLDPTGNYEKKGVYIGVVGARLEKEEVMEYQDMIITEKQNTSAKGYGVNGDKTKAGKLAPFAKFYKLTHFPSYEEVQNGNKDKFTVLGEDANGNPVYISNEAYKQRMRVSIEAFLAEADDQGKAAGKPAYVHAVGLGLGAWSKIPPLKTSSDAQLGKLQLEVYREVLQNNRYQNISNVNFSYFPDACKDQIGNSVGNTSIEYSNRNPADPLMGNDSGKLLVAMYAWDGNSFPGNEFAEGRLAASGDPAAACCSTIFALQNPEVNPQAFKASKLKVHDTLLNNFQKKIDKAISDLELASDHEDKMPQALKNIRMIRAEIIAFEKSEAQDSPIKESLSLLGKTLDSAVERDTTKSIINIRVERALNKMNLALESKDSTKTIEAIANIKNLRIEIETLKTVTNNEPLKEALSASDKKLYKKITSPSQIVSDKISALDKKIRNKLNPSKPTVNKEAPKEVEQAKEKVQKDSATLSGNMTQP